MTRPKDAGQTRIRKEGKSAAITAASLSAPQNTVFTVFLGGASFTLKEV